jgi:type IV pilus assembly protein PilY1
VSVADAWVPASAGTGRTKSKDDWHTLLMFAEGRGAGTNLWSSSPSCDTGFNQSYTATYQYYCGYYCLDVTNSLTPAYKWRLGVPAASAPYMGAPWSKPMISRVLTGGNEKWVAFIGGGVSAPGAANSGKGFFIVDLVDGNVLWSYTKANDANLDYPMPAPPSIVDTDNDGFIDTIYLGDLGSNMWRFELCRAADGDNCSTVHWSGGRFFEATSASGNRPIYTTAAVAKDPYGNIWVYWGTGDKTDPTSPSAQEKFFALKDSGSSTSLTLGDMENITSDAQMSDSSKSGYYINMTGQGEKILAEPTVFGGVVYFTTFTPPQGSDPCAQGGTARLYGVDYTTGAAALRTVGSLPTAPAVRSITLAGGGIPSAPVISMKPAGTSIAAAQSAATAAALSGGASSAVAAAAGAAAAAAAAAGADATEAAAAAAAAGADATAAAAAGAAAVAALSSSVTPDLYVTTSGGGGGGAQTQRAAITPPGLANRTNLLFWKDRRVE